MSIRYVGIKGARTRGAFSPSVGLPVAADALMPRRERPIVKGDAFVAREAGTIADVVNLPNPAGFAIGDRIIFTGTVLATAAHWTWAPPVGQIPASPYDPTKKVPVIVVSEDDNNE